jgi:hypothetical protein
MHFKTYSAFQNLFLSINVRPDNFSGGTTS